MLLCGHRRTFLTVSRKKDGVKSISLVEIVVVKHPRATRLNKDWQARGKLFKQKHLFQQTSTYGLSCFGQMEPLY
jgi:hypothetical protein